jgi:hypothetical protein
MAMQMTVLGQVHLARLQYENAARVLARSSALASADRKIEKFTKDGASSGTQSQGEMVAAQSVSIISEMRRYQAIAQLYAANGRLQASLGFEPNLGDIQNTSLADLTKQVSEAMTQWQTGSKVKEEAQAIEKSSLRADASTAVPQSSAATVSTATASQPVPLQVEPWRVRTATVTTNDYQPLSWNNFSGTTPAPVPTN